MRGVVAYPPFCGRSAAEPLRARPPSRWKFVKAGKLLSHPLFFCASQDEFHSAGGYLTVQRFPDQPPLAWDILAAGAELGYRSNTDLNGSNRTGFTVAQANVRDGRRLSLSRAFLHPAKDRPNLRVITNAMVVRVSMDGDRARGVVFHRNGALHKLRVRKEVVLAAGAVQSPHLLLLSGVGPRRQLQEAGKCVIPHAENCADSGEEN